MKILHITTVRSGSTGKTATDLKALLIPQGHEFRIAFSDPDNKPLDGDILIGSKLDHKVHAFLSRLTGLQGYFSYFATKRFLKQVKAYQPDVVQLGNLHANYINLPLLFKFLGKERIHVVMILHDCWFFTGKCSHFTSRKCEKWKTQCHHCPALKSDNASWFFDFSSKMFRDRKRWYEKLSSHTVIAVSDWLKNLAEQSPVFSKAHVIRVYNWIDTDIFKPATSEQIDTVCKKYGLSKDIKYLISVSAGWKAGTSRTQDAVAFAEKLPEQYRLMVVGGADEGIFSDKVVCIPHTTYQSELVALYSLSTAYLHFSVEDTFGKVIAEAMSCGTVPIVFKATACGDTAGPFGIAVQPHDVDAMIAALPETEDAARKENVRKYVIDNYAHPANLERYWLKY